MARFKLACFLMVTAFVPSTMFAQVPNNAGQYPIIEGFRYRATNNVLTQATRRFTENSALSGKLCPSCAQRRQARFDKQDADQELLAQTKEASLEKLQQEAKKAKFEAKALEEADYEKHKPWDVAAPENLESPSPLLQEAAKSKQDQDLAPNKIRALEYLATLGCNKDPKVEAAILLGLKDYNPAVRYAAIRAVITAARGDSPVSYNPFADTIVPGQPENSMVDPIKYGLEEPGYPAKVPGEPPAEPEAEAPAPEPPKKKCGCKVCLQKLKGKIKGLCQRCKGHGCQQCNYGGHSQEACDACQGWEEIPCEECEECQECVGCGKPHDGCKTCCPSEPIIAELKRIAFEEDPDRDDCYYEPNLDVRNLALEALNVCPKGRDVIPEVPGVPESGGDNVPSILEGPGDNTSPAGNNDATAGGRVSSFISAGYAQPGPGTSLLMQARIARFYQRGFLIQFSGDYLIPTTKQLLVQLTNGETHIVDVVKSEVGFAQVVPVGGAIFDSPSPMISVGVIEE